MDEQDSAAEERGLDFLRTMWDHNLQQAMITDANWEHYGKIAPRTIEALGEMMQELYYFSICHPQCILPDEKSHQARYMAGKIFNSSIASLHMLRIGLYNESLTICRQIGELANLIWLSSIDEKQRYSLERGKNPPSPRVVRKKLESKLHRAPITKERYSALSQRATHGTNVNFWSYLNREFRDAVGLSNKIYTGGWHDTNAAVVSLNELSTAIGAAGFGISLLGSKYADRSKRIEEKSFTLLENIGRLDYKFGIDKEEERLISSHFNTMTGKNR